MTTSHITRSIRRPLLAGLAVLAAATTACSDARPTAPFAPAGDADAIRPIVHATTQLTIGDTVVQTFTVAPGWNNSYVIASVHKVDIQANSVCDPLLSSYGPTEWDKPCITIVTPLAFTAKSWTDANGHPQVTFFPDVRFAPGKVNTLTLKDKSASDILSRSRIVWCPTGSRTCVDEAATDASVATRLNTNGTLSRRVKHFSGYTVIAD